MPLVVKVLPAGRMLSKPRELRLSHDAGPCQRVRAGDRQPLRNAGIDRNRSAVIVGEDIKPELIARVLVAANEAPPFRSSPRVVSTPNALLFARTRLARFKVVAPRNVLAPLRISVPNA